MRMLFKHNVFLSLLSVLALRHSACQGQAGSGHVKEVVAITEVFGDGQKTTAAVLAFDKPIQNAGLEISDFSVANRTITKIYASRTATKAASGADGSFVVLELAPTDTAAATFVQQGFHSALKPAKVLVKQVGKIATVDNASYGPYAGFITNTRQVNRVVDDFTQHQYTDAKTGKSIAYNLFVPKHYDKAKKYPLVLFIHDAGVLSPEVKTTLVQGLGAVVWATPAEQAKHECFVLAPQFDKENPAGEDANAALVRDALVNLVTDLTGRYSLDKTRLYTTGQSMGCMSSIAINIKYPTLFAASFLVAGQWDAAKVAPMAKEKLWIIVSEGDLKAFPGMNAITAELEKHGATITRATWNGRASAPEFAADVKQVRAAGTAIQYTPLKKGTVVPATMRDDGGSNHIGTWRIAYTIEGVRDWLFSQQQ